MNPVTTFEALKASDRVALTALDALFDALPAVERTDMLGSWEGGCFKSDHPGEAQLVALSWVGKDFHSENDVDPIVCLSKEGTRVPSPALGKATLRSVEYRGVVTATMVYDKHPIFDHFRRIDGATVLGCMDRKGDATPLYFWLRALR